MSEICTYSVIIRMNRKELLEKREAVNNYLKTKIFAIQNVKKTSEENKKLLNDVITFLISKGIDLESYLDEEVKRWLVKTKS